MLQLAHEAGPLDQAGPSAVMEALHDRRRPRVAHRPAARGSRPRRSSAAERPVEISSSARRLERQLLSADWAGAPLRGFCSTESSSAEAPAFLEALLSSRAAASRG